MLPNEEGKQTSQESASISKRLRSNQASVKNVDNLIAMEGPKLEDAKSKSSAVICQACTELRSRRKKQKFNYVCAGLFSKICCLSQCLCSVMLGCTHFLQDTVFTVCKF